MHQEVWCSKMFALIVTSLVVRRVSMQPLMAPDDTQRRHSQWYMSRLTCPVQACELPYECTERSVQLRAAPVILLTLGQ
jgi:hypothetical protein